MKKQNKTGSIGVVGATAIGVGGMMGAYIHCSAWPPTLLVFGCQYHF
jgi:permease family protein